METSIHWSNWPFAKNTFPFAKRQMYLGRVRKEILLYLSSSVSSCWPVYRYFFTKKKLTLAVDEQSDKK